MRFQIESVQADGHWVPLCDDRASSIRDNTYTLIIGQNAVGKSRLLRKIVSNYIFAPKGIEHIIPKSKTYFDIQDHLPNFLPLSFESNRLPPVEFKSKSRLTLLNNWENGLVPDYQADGISISDYEGFSGDFEDEPASIGRAEVMPAAGSSWTPSHVIAVSTGRHDRFPNTSQYKKEAAYTTYSYIGTERPHGSSVPSSIASLIDGLLKGQQNIYKLSKIFEYLGFTSYLDLKLILDIKQLKKLGESEKKEIYFSCGYSLIEFLLGESDHIPFNEGHRLKFFDVFRKQKRYHLELNFWNLELGLDRDILSDIAPLMKFGLVKIYDVTLIKSSDKSRLRLSQASSGQQCMLTIMLGIAGAIRNGSLICIDEPEISLHPQWQSNIVKQLQEVFSEYYGCHFIIATHSPQVVSGLATESGYVLNLEERKLYHSYEYAKRSADFQLAEIFNSPGQNNEYLLRMTLLLLTKVTRREKLTPEENQTAHKLFFIREKMGDTDPVYHLIGQLEALY